MIATARATRLWHLGNGGRVVAVMLWGSLLVCSIIGGALSALGDPWTWFLLLVSVGFLVRSVFFRVELREREVLVVSWLRTYKIPRHDIENVLVGRYSGALTRFTSSGFFSRVFWTVGFAVDHGDDRSYPVTLLPRRSVERAAAQLGQSLGVAVIGSTWT
ncbi:hypothetical protein [Agromyces larvae]|uniref:PH domain-containing protein n=1 Tax=Agromyces larvae TaxID=2929802 RepID=A0ABY4BWG2_9MICO|nr:hypothetical protein [Agromyces larvae]UOE43565.1 hypothetical protein MTO99_15510 [Agromyces larvae]